MAELVMVLGPSGSGKTTSIFPNPKMGITGLNPEETLLISFASKAVPRKLYVTNKDILKPEYAGRTANRVVVPSGEPTLNGKPVSKDVWLKAAISKMMESGKVKNIVLDDFQYLSTMHILDNALTKGFDKFAVNGSMVFQVLKHLMDLPENILVFVLAHTEVETVNFVEQKSMKLGGKFVKSGLGTPEGLCNTVLFTESVSEKGEESVTIKKYFITQSDGTDTAKSLPDMFPYRIPNDLGLVEKAMREYFN